MSGIRKQATGSKKGASVLSLSLYVVLESVNYDCGIYFSRAPVNAGETKLFKDADLIDRYKECPVTSEAGCCRLSVRAKRRLSTS